MKRTLFWVLVIVAGSYGSAYWLIRSNVQSQLDETARLLFGAGTLTYGHIWVSPLGDVSVGDLSFESNIPAADFSIERLSLETDNWLELAQLGQALIDNETPEQLTLSFEGIRVDVSGVQRMLDPGGTLRRSFLAAGCGEQRTYFNFSDLDNMGFHEIRSDMVLQYQLSPARDNLRINADFTTESMYRLGMLLDIALADASGIAMVTGATLNRMQLRVEDLGYVTGVMAFCADETELTVEEYHSRHVDAWVQLSRQLGVVLGDEVVNAYADFIDQPDTFRLESFARLNATKVMTIREPQLLLDRLALQIVVNGGEPRPLQLNLEQLNTEVNSRPTPSDTRGAVVEGSPVPRPPRIVEVPVARLPNWLGTEMIVTLVDGREFRGEVLSMNEGQVRFSQSVVGGTMIIPLQLNSIRRVRVLNQ